MLFGAHMSIAGGLARAVERARTAGCECLQVFTSSSNQWKARAVDPAEADSFRAAAREAGLSILVSHGSYLVNLASPDPALRARSEEATGLELDRCSAFGIGHLVIHPGAHMGEGPEAGIRRVGESLRRLLGEGRGPGVRVLLEGTAGQGTVLGRSFEEIAALLRAIDCPERTGVCLDTCHLFASGHDLRTPEGLEAALRSFDRTVGRERLKVVHLNDSKGDLGSRADRHEHIGRGRLGKEAFRGIVNHPFLAGLPGILETPKSDDLHEDIENLTLLRSLRKVPGAPRTAADRRAPRKSRGKLPAGGAGKRRGE